jgi:hypothetical protein
MIPAFFVILTFSVLLPGSLQERTRGGIIRKEIWLGGRDSNSERGECLS